MRAAPSRIRPEQGEEVIVRMAAGLLGAYRYFRSQTGSLSEHRLQAAPVIAHSIETNKAMLLRRHCFLLSSIKRTGVHGRAARDTQCFDIHIQLLKSPPHNPRIRAKK
jgi:hypothetical protein